MSPPAGAKAGTVPAKLFLAGMLAFCAGCAVPPAPRSAQADLASASPAAAVTPPPANSGSLPPGASPVGYAGGPAAAGPADAGVVPIGTTAVTPAGQNVVPTGAMDMTPTAPGVPGAAPPPSSAPVMAVPMAAEGDKTKDDDGGFEWSSLAPENVWKNLEKSAGYGPDERIARASFQEGEALFRQKKYEEAAEKFYTASWRWPESSLEEDAMFLLGECYFFSDRYSKAHDAYANLLKAHDNTRYLDTVMAREFAIGRYWEQMDLKDSRWPTTPNFTDNTLPLFDTFDNALGAYETVRLHDPTGPLADSSVMATANAHFRKNHWEEAAYNYDLVRKEYPKSQFQQDAHILGLQSKLRMYQGPVYDVAPLNNAKEIADQTLTQFHGRLGPEENRVAEARAKIIEQKAEREWMMAQYYEKKGYYGAARYYYKTAINKYPQTPVAAQARIRMEQIQKEPDSPPNRFAWLTQLFERER